MNIRVKCKVYITLRSVSFTLQSNNWVWWPKILQFSYFQAQNDLNPICTRSRNISKGKLRPHNDGSKLAVLKRSFENSLNTVLPISDAMNHDFSSVLFRFSSRLRSLRFRMKKSWVDIKPTTERYRKRSNYSWKPYNEIFKFWICYISYLV